MGIKELLALFLKQSDIISLAQMFHTNHTFCCLIHDTLTICLWESLLTFILCSYLPKFFTILDQTNSCITGSIALKTITPACNWSPDDLNVIVPAGLTATWVSFFHNHSFKCLSHVDDIKYHHYQMGISLVMVYRHPSLQVCYHPPPWYYQLA